MFDTAEFKIIDRAIALVWNAIAADCDFIEDNEQAIEMCLDCDRIVEMGDSPEAQSLLRQAYKDHGYRKVIEYWSNRILLV